MKFQLDMSFPSENSLGEMSWAPAWYSKQAAIIWRRVPIMVAACVRKDEEKWSLIYWATLMSILKAIPL